jgi:hypothetical protein
VFDMVATDRLAITGMHLHSPGFAPKWEQTL